MEDAALDSAALEHAALARVELVETRGEERLDGRRDRHVAVVRLLDERDHLLHEKRIALGRRTDPFP